MILIVQIVEGQMCATVQDASEALSELDDVHGRVLWWILLDDAVDIATGMTQPFDFYQI